MAKTTVYWSCPYCGIVLDDQNSECGCSVKYAPRDTGPEWMPYEPLDEPIILCNFDLINGELVKIY